MQRTRKGKKEGGVDVDVNDGWKFVRRRSKRQKDKTKDKSVSTRGPSLNRARLLGTVGMMGMQTR